MARRCENCGGVVTTPQASGVIICEYCGATIHLARPAATRAPADEPAGRGAARRPARGVLIVGVLLVVAVGGVAYLVRGGALSVLGEWYSPGACLVDANGDAALDLVGWGGSPSDQRNLWLVDGATGKRIWSRSGDYASEATVLCSGRGGFAVARPNFTLELFSLTARDTPRIVRLSDKVEQYARGEGCLQIVTSDQRTVGLDAKTGSQTRCDPIEPLRHPYTVAGTTDAGASTTTLGGVRYSVAGRAVGTPVLTVSAERDGAQLWSVPLRYVAVSRRTMLVVTPETVATYGAEPGQTDVGVLIGMSPRTGAVQYELSQGSSWSARHLAGFQYNGRYLIVTWGFGVHAYEPATGERVWHIGGR